MELEAVKNVSSKAKSESIETEKGINKEPEKVAEEPAKTTGINKTEDGNEKEEKEATERQISKAIEHVKSLKNMRTHCEFTYHENINRISIKVINEGNGEVIREIPPEESLEMVEKMWELAGILVDKKI